MMNGNEHLEMLKLADGLQNSNEPSVAELAKAYIDLHSQFDLLADEYDVVYNKYLYEVGSGIIHDNHDLLKRLED